MVQYKNRWQDIKNFIKKEYAKAIDDENFNIDDCPEPTSIRVAGDTAYFVYKDIDENKLKDMCMKYERAICVAFCVLCEKVRDIHLTSKEAAKEEGGLPKASKCEKYSFANFLAGENNKLACSAALVTAESAGEVFNPLFIYGESSTGKTHLMRAIANFIKESNPKANVIYETAEDFSEKIIEAVRSGNLEQIKRVRNRYRNVDALLLDDMDRIIDRDVTIEEFFDTFDKLLMQGKQIVVSAMSRPEQYTNLNKRYVSRLKQGMVVKLNYPDDTTKRAFLNRLADENDKEIEDDLIETIIRNANTIRDVQGQFNIALCVARIQKSERLTLDLVRSARELYYAMDLMVGK